MLDRLPADVENAGPGCEPRRHALEHRLVLVLAHVCHGCHALDAKTILGRPGSWSPAGHVDGGVGDVLFDDQLVLRISIRLSATRRNRPASFRSLPSLTGRTKWPRGQQLMLSRRSLRRDCSFHKEGPTAARPGLLNAARTS
jgi:hypothetical protein